MPKSVVPLLAICLMAASAAQAQSYGGGHGRGSRGQRSPNGSTQSSSAPGARKAPDTPVDDVDIIGVVKAIDAADGRVTIAYQAVDARNWPPGTMPFAVSKPELLAGVTTGEKVRFKLDSEQITDLKPF